MNIIESIHNFISLTRRWYRDLAIITSVFCMLSSAIVIHDLRQEIKQTFHDQFNILSLDSQEAIASNYASLENIVSKLLSVPTKDIAKNFIQYTKKIGQYTNNIVFLTDTDDNVILQTPSPQNIVQNLSPENRTGIKRDLEQARQILLSNKIFMGPIVRVNTETAWRFPIARSIIAGDKYLGSVIFITNLEKFSESLVKSHINLKLRPMDEKHFDDIRYLEAENNVRSNITIEDALSYTAFIKAIIHLRTDIEVSHAYSPLHHMTRNIALTMAATHIQKLFWNRFNNNLIIFCFCAVTLLLAVLLKISGIARKVSSLEKTLVTSALKLQHLVPGFAALTSLRPLERHDTLLVNIERFVNANSLIIDTLEKQNNIILAHEKQLPELQKHFLSCMSALHEHSLCFVEKIEDIYQEANTTFARKFMQKSTKSFV